MKKFVIMLIVYAFVCSQSYAFNLSKTIKTGIFRNDVHAVKSLLNSQVRYANKEDYQKFIGTYDSSYINSDGLNYNDYSSLIKDIWNSYSKIKYGIKIQDINIKGDLAEVKILETSDANIQPAGNMPGVLKSRSNSIYYLKKIDNKWKVISDTVIDETTSMMYGEAQNIDIKLTAPKEIEENVEYTASLEFKIPENIIAIASIANNKVEYPQKPAKEVFRKMPDDNILERLFVSNSDNKNEYIIASIGLTRADVKDMGIKISLTGFGYKIIRVNVIPHKIEENNVEE